MAVLVVAEKQSAALEYAKALNVTVKKDGYIDGNGYIITWCRGHLVGYSRPEAYAESGKIGINDLPLIPQEWQTEVFDYAKKQYKTVKDLMLSKEVTEIVNGADAGREGELIFYHVYNKAKCKKPVKRLWVSSMEDKALKDAFANLKDGKEYENLSNSAFCRAKADWLIGFNGSIVLNRLYYKPLNVGRVQTPTLEMLRKRLEEITNFKKEKYHNVHLPLIGDGVNADSVLEKIKELSEAEKIKSDCDGKTAEVKSVKREEKTVNPPKLYDLTTLQREANRLFGYTAQQSLDCVQALYEKKLCSYPRTDSQYITEDMIDSVVELLPTVSEKLPFSVSGYNSANVSKLANNKKVSDHYALLPTVEIASYNLESLPETERNILYLIVNKLFCAIGEKHVYESVKAEVECENYTFTARGKSVKSEGWKEAERNFKAFLKDKLTEDNGEKDEKEPSQPLTVSEGQTFENVICNITEHWTSPPKHYTEDTLLSAMERAGADEVTEEVERSGLGTPATRAGIIEKLIKDGYAKREKKNIICTESGIELLSLAPEMLKSPKFTAEWEDGLARMAQGKINPNQFMEEVNALVGEIVKTAKNSVDASKISQGELGETVGKCPRPRKDGTPCGKNVIENKMTFFCEDEENCGFIMWKNNNLLKAGGKIITKPMAAALLKDGKVLVKGLQKQGKSGTFDAVLVMTDNGKHTNFEYEFGGSANKESLGKCPRCGSDVCETPRAFSCTDRDNCGFTVWKTSEKGFMAAAKKEVTAELVKTLLKDGKARLEGCYSVKTGKTYTATVVLEDDGKYANIKPDFSEKS